MALSLVAKYLNLFNAGELACTSASEDTEVDTLDSHLQSAFPNYTDLYCNQSKHSENQSYFNSEFHFHITVTISILFSFSKQFILLIPVSLNRNKLFQFLFQFPINGNKTGCDPGTLKDRYLQNSWRCYLATILL